MQTFLFLLAFSLFTQIICCVDRNYSKFWKLHYLIYTHWAFWTSVEVIDFSWNTTTCHNNLCHHLAQNPLRISLTPLFSVMCSLSELLESKDHINSLLLSFWATSSANLVVRVELYNSRSVTCTALQKMWKWKKASPYNYLGWNQVYF